MASYDVAIARTGGFTSLAEAKAHRSVIGKLSQQVDLAKSVANDCREVDQVDVGKTGTELYKDLAAGKGHVIMLSQPEGSPLLGAELNYNPADGTTRSLVVDMGDSKLTQQGSSFKLEENGVTTYFRKDEQRGVFTIMDGEADVPRIFGDADPAKLTAGTIQLNQPILMF
jgi:hypothetical protein